MGSDRQNHQFALLTGRSLAAVVTILKQNDPLFTEIYILTAFIFVLLMSCHSCLHILHSSLNNHVSKTEAVRQILI